jgi:hypothetical protein
VPPLASTKAVLDIDSENGRASRWHTDVISVEAFPLKAAPTQVSGSPALRSPHAIRFHQLVISDG